MTAAPEVKTLDAIITQLGLSLLVVGRNAQGFASSRKPVGPMTIVSLHVGTFKSGPQRPEPQKCGVPRRSLPPLRPRSGAIGHAEHDAPRLTKRALSWRTPRLAFEGGQATPQPPAAEVRVMHIDRVFHRDAGRSRNSTT